MQHLLITSDFVDDQVHFPVGALPQFADNLIVFVDVQLLQVLSGDELELLQDVDGGAGAMGRGVHSRGGTARSGLETDVPVEQEGKKGSRWATASTHMTPPLYTQHTYCYCTYTYRDGGSEWVESRPNEPLCNLWFVSTELQDKETRCGLRKTVFPTTPTPKTALWGWNTASASLETFGNKTSVSCWPAFHSNTQKTNLIMERGSWMFHWHTAPEMRCHYWTSSLTILQKLLLFSFCSTHISNSLDCADQTERSPESSELRIFRVWTHGQDKSKTFWRRLWSQEEYFSTISDVLLMTDSCKNKSAVKTNQLQTQETLTRPSVTTSPKRWWKRWSVKWGWRRGGKFFYLWIWFNDPPD